MLLDRLKQASTSSNRSGKYGALLLIDLDNFKTLNDTLGHDMGDLLLKQVGQRLTACVRAEDTVARLGGDEFVLVLQNLSEMAHDATTEAKVIGEKFSTSSASFINSKTLLINAHQAWGHTVQGGAP